MSELIKRILTGGILALLVLFLIFKSPTGFVFLMIVISVIGVYEFLKLIHTPIVNKIISTTALALSSYFAVILPTIVNDAIFTKTFYTVVLLVVCCWWLNNFWMIANYPKSKPVAIFTPIKATLLFAPLFLLSPLLEPDLILLLFLIVWGADSFAYFSGRAFGKHKLAPNLSNGKTIEGLIGGLISVLFITIMWMFYYRETNWVFLLLALITGIFSIIGDLYESIYKREAGVKNSSNILPGHGGVFDRIDGLLAATPVFIASVQFL